MSAAVESERFARDMLYSTAYGHDIEGLGENGGRLFLDKT
jgi:hypothetical protein